MPLLTSQSSFSVIVQTSSFSCCFMSFCCQIFTDFYQLNVITVVSNISRWTLTGLKQLRFTWFSINHFLEKISESQIWSSGSFEERLFPEALLSLFLSGGMIFISHLLRRLYFFISQSALDCIICLDHFNLILLRHIIGDIERRMI